MRERPRFTAHPAASEATTSSNRNSPNSPATLSRTPSGWRLFEKASLDRAHALMGAESSAGITTTGRLRSRSGTIANQSAAPITAAASAPRDWVSMIATQQTASAG